MRTVVENSIGMKFVPVNLDKHQERQIYFSQYLLGNVEFQRVDGCQRPDFSKDNYPVTELSWFDSIEFCRRLSSLPSEKQARRRYRLPFADEWEHVCRGGSTSRFFWGESDDLVGQYGRVGSDSRCVPSGQFSPSPIGIYDLYGNLWEWCQDTPSDDNFELGDLNPRNVRWLCGGAWNTPASMIGSALRDQQHPMTERTTIGLRLVFTVDESEVEDRVIDENRRVSTQVTLVNSIGMSLTPIPKSSPTKMDDNAPRLLIFPEDCQQFLGTYLVTRREFESVMGRAPAVYRNYPFRVNEDRIPVSYVSFDDAEKFCERLTQLPQELENGHKYRLPTEDKWEYGCCCGESAQNTSYRCTSETAWTRENSRLDVNNMIVGEKLPNAWGLNDMLGSISEWCSNYYLAANTRFEDPVLNPYARRVARGGNIAFPRELCQPNSRFAVMPDHRSFYVGFRVLMYRCS